MDRPKRAAATRITDFRKYHLSGDLDQEVQWLVNTRVTQFEMTTTNNTEELKQQLEAEKEESRRLNVRKYKISLRWRD